VKDPASQTWHICQKLVAHGKNKYGSNKEKHEDARTISFKTLVIFLSEIVLLTPPPASI
jgi:hypothetical protein